MLLIEYNLSTISIYFVLTTKFKLEISLKYFAAAAFAAARALASDSLPRMRGKKRATHGTRDLERERERERERVVSPQTRRNTKLFLGDGAERNGCKRCETVKNCSKLISKT